MKIRIIDYEKCETCKTRRCKFLNISNVKEDFVRLPSETSVCPTDAIDENGPSDTDLKKGHISSDECVECGLCARFCSHDNLVAEEVNANVNKFNVLSDLQLNAVVSLYLSLLFGFAANTNRNRSLPFDCYVSSVSGKEAFVEVDYGDDSLECLRRILGDVITFSKSHPIANGIIVLSTLPKVGSRDVYAVINKMRKFPSTSGLKVYMTTISILRMFCVSKIPVGMDFDDLLFDCEKEDECAYMNRVAGIIAQEKKQK